MEHILQANCKSSIHLGSPRRKTNASLCYSDNWYTFPFSQAFLKSSGRCPSPSAPKYPEAGKGKEWTGETENTTRAVHP